MHEMHQMHEIGLCYAQILQMHQVHDSCTSYMTAVTVNLAVFLLKMHQMHQMHESRVDGKPGQGTDISWHRNHLQKNVTIMYNVTHTQKSSIYICQMIPTCPSHWGKGESEYYNIQNQYQSIWMCNMMSVVGLTRGGTQPIGRIFSHILTYRYG